MPRSNSRLVSRWVLGALAGVSMLVSASTAFAQFDRGTISGTVKDASGGVVPGVTVTATSLQTQTPTVAVTDATGFYTFPNLRPGVYSVSAELEGFKKVLRENLQLDAGGALTIDFALETGAITEQVTVTAETPTLQTDVAIRRVVESKDIELLSFSGRNPIGVASLKPGVVGGSFNSRGFNDLGNGGFNINGSRSDENNITVDGATAIRTRSSGNIIGIQNVDAIQEVQVLTANYMPEYGRSSGGQIRFVTKSGSNRFSGSASIFYRDESLQANSWARNATGNPTQSEPAAFDYKQYGYSFGGPIPVGMFKDKLFFFGAQEWVNFFQESTAVITVPSMKMRQGDFSELLNPNNGFYSGARIIIDPLTGQPFPGNIIPADRLSPNGMAIMRMYPEPNTGAVGQRNASITSPNPQDQRKDNIRFDYRMNEKNNFAYRYTRYNWVAVDAFRDNLPFARTDWERPNYTSTASWTSTLTSNLINELTYTYSKDNVYIDVFTENGAHQRSRYGISYPYIFGGEGQKEIPDKIPTVTGTGFQTIDGGPYPASSAGPIHTFTNVSTWVKGRHTLKAGVQVEYSGEDDFDQINVSPIPGQTNNQNGRFEFADNRPGGTSLAASNLALGLFSAYGELGQRNFTAWRSLATDVFVQDSWKPTSQLTVEGGIRWVFWPPWYSTTNNIANFDPRFFDPSQVPAVNPANGALTGGNRYNGIVLPGDGFEGDGGAGLPPDVNSLFRGEPRGFSQMHYNVLEPRLGLSYQFNEKTIFRASSGIFHNRVTLNDSTLLGGNAPFQPQSTVSNGSVDSPAGATGTRFSGTINGQDPVFKHPTSYMWAFGVQREIPWGFTVDVTYLGRRGLYLQRERNINQLQPGTLQRNPGVNIAALRPYAGYNVIRISENSGNSKYHSLQVSADRRYRNGLKVGFAYTLGKSEDNASNKRNVMWNTYDDTNYWGASDYDRRHVASVYYIYDLPFWRDQSTTMRNLLGGWQVSGATFFRTGTPFAVLRNNDIAGVGDGGFLQPYNMVGDPKAGANQQFSTAVGDGNYWFNTAAFAAPAAGTFGNAPRNNIYNPGEQQWDIALFKNFNLGGTRRAQFRAEFFNFPNHPNWGNVQTGALQGQGWADPTSANFGRVTTKNGNRDIQLSLRFLF
jgi:hypothetical protein